MAFLGCPRGHKIDSETRCTSHIGPNYLVDTRPRTRALREASRPAAGMTLGWYGARVRRSSCLSVQVSGIESLSFLPNGQNDRCNLASHGETGHGRPHARGQQRRIEVPERAVGGTGPSGRALEHGFQLMIVILIQAARRRLSLGTQHLAATRHSIFPADPSFQGQTAVCPELPFGPEAMRRLDQGNQ